MKTQTRVALLLFTMSSSTSESEFFLNFNTIPNSIAVFDCYWSEGIDFVVHKNYDSSANHNRFKCQTSLKSNALLLRKIFDLGYTHIIYSHHDTFNATPDSYEMILDICQNIDLSKFGLVGFNVLHDNEITLFIEDKLKYGTLCRSILQEGNGYYNSSCLSTKPVPLSNLENKYFPIEIPMWSICLVSKSSFDDLNYKHNFEFHLEFDDIALSFLKKNTPNVCFPEISFFHQQTTSLLFGRAYKSPMSTSQRQRLEIAHSKWLSLWGFEFGIRKSTKNFFYLVWQEFLSNFSFNDTNTLTRVSYSRNKCSKRYRGTLIDSYVNGKPPSLKEYQ